jgi:gas vesicle protein
MRYREVPKPDHFWSGFVFGAALGGALGVLLTTESGRTARERLGTAVIDIRGRLNGVADTPDLEVEEAEESSS